MKALCPLAAVCGSSARSVWGRADRLSRAGAGRGLGIGWGAEKGTRLGMGTGWRTSRGRGQGTEDGLTCFPGLGTGARGPGPGQDRFGDGAEVWCGSASVARQHYLWALSPISALVIEAKATDKNSVRLCPWCWYHFPENSAFWYENIHQHSRLLVLTSFNLFFISFCCQCGNNAIYFHNLLPIPM